MSQRLTVVLDDEELYKELKLRALADGVPAKDVIESSLREYLSGGRLTKVWNWDEFDSWQDEIEDLNAALPPGMTDYSDVKQHLYAEVRRPERLRMLAEEPSTYGAL